MAYNPLSAVIPPRTSLLDYCLAKHRHARDDAAAYHLRTLDYYNLYRCIYTGKGKDLPYKNKVMLPLTFSAIWTAVAMQVQTSLGEYPYLEFEANSPEEQPMARRITAMVNAQAEKIRIVDKAVDFLGSAEIYGTGLWRHGWAHLSQRHKFRQVIGGQEYEKSQIVTIKNTPDLETVDILNFFPQPGFKRIEDMAYCTHAYLIDFDALLDMQFSAEQQGAPQLFYPEAIAELARKGYPGGGGEAHLIPERQNQFRSYSEWQARRTEMYAKPVEIVEYWGLVPRELARDGYTNRVVTIANGSIILRDECNPYWHLQKPFISFSPMPDPHFFWGVGKAEIGARLAQAANKLVSGRIDAVEMFLGPAFFAAEGLSLGGQSLALWPGRVVRVNGSVSDDRIKPISPDLRGTQLVFDEVASIARYLTQGHGLHEDTLQGLMSGDRTTAREFLGRMEQGRTRIGLESRLFEINALEPAFEIFHKLNRQHLPAPQWVRSIGALAHFDINTGLPIPPEPELLTLDDLNADFRVRAKGASQLLSKSMKRQDLMTAIQTIGAIPPFLAASNVNAILNKFWRTFDFDPGEMTNIRVPMLNMLGMDAATGADAMLGGGNTTTPQLNPGLLGAQPNNPIAALGGLLGG